MPPKKSTYQFSWELPDNVPYRNPKIPGGKKKKKGGSFLDTLMDVAKDVAPYAIEALAGQQVPPQHAIKISGGIALNDGRGNIIETNEAIKGGKKRGRPKKAGNIFSDIVDGAENIYHDIAGKKGGNIFSDIVSGAENVYHDIAGKKKKGGLQSGSVPTFASNALEQPIKGGAAGDGFVGVKTGKGKKLSVANLKKHISKIETSIDSIKKLF